MDLLFGTVARKAIIFLCVGTIREKIVMLVAKAIKLKLLKFGEINWGVFIDLECSIAVGEEQFVVTVLP